ncbi:rod shape-determining protein MreC [Candidatus Berkelbacteria bacterium]|nr:rod shape-determining protein MreC [Candidatus Berkelbacteria bacterium]
MKHRFSIGLLGLVIVAIFASASLDWLRSWGRAALRPAQPIAHAVIKTRGFFQTLRAINSLQAQLSAAQVAQVQALADVIRLSEELNQAQRITAELATVPVESRDQYLAARVSGRSPLGLFNELTLTAGSRDGVVPEQPVLKSGFVVGIIRSVDADSSVVQLLTSPQSLIPVILQQSRGQGLLRGGLDGLVVSDLPIDSQPQVGEAVLTSSLGNRLQADLPVGQVGSLLSHDSEILQRVSLVSPVRFDTLEEVLILIGGQS